MDHVNNMLVLVACVAMFSIQVDSEGLLPANVASDPPASTTNGSLTTHPATQPTTHPATQPTTHPATQPTSHSTAQPTTAVFTTAPSPTPTPTPKPSQGTWYFNDTKVVCMYLKMATRIEIKYTTAENKSETMKVNIPADNSTSVVDSDSKCSDKTDVITLQWMESETKWNVTLTFKKDKSEYKMSTMSLQYSVGDSRQSASTNKTGKDINANNKNNYKCNSETSYTLDGQDTLDSHVQMKFSEMQVQAFKDDQKAEFSGHSEQCSDDTTPSNIVPIAVGAALAGLVLIVLIAYIIGRNRNRSGYESV